MNHHNSLYDIDTLQIPKAYRMTIQMLKDDHVQLFAFDNVGAEFLMKEVEMPSPFTFEFSNLQKVTENSTEISTFLVKTASGDNCQSIIARVFKPSHFLYQEDEYFAIFDPNNFVFIEISALGEFTELKVYLNKDDYQKFINDISVAIPGGLYLASGYDQQYTKRYIKPIQEGNIQDKTIEISMSGTFI